MIKLKNVRGSFLDIFVPKPFKPGDTPKYKAAFLIPKGSALDKEIEKSILEAAGEKFTPAKAAAIIKSIRNNPNKFCYQDGDTKDYDGYAGMMALTAGSVTRPLVLDRDKTPLTIADGRPYSGCYVNGNIEFFGYNNSGNGISASLIGIQFYKDSDPFSGAPIANPDDFDEYEDDCDDEAALA